LKSVVPVLQSPSLFWLDGHWCGGDSFGEQDECPLPEELEIIGQSPHEHFILIDDARLFTAPPPLPHRIDAWPSIAEIVNRLQARSAGQYMVILDDVIIAVPQHAQDFVANWCQQVTTAASNTNGQQDGLQLIKRGLRQLARRARR
jgi:hypothetical protein